MIKCKACERRRKWLLALFQKGYDMVLSQGYIPIAPADVVLMRRPSGEYVAFDNVNKRELAVVDDADDFEAWKVVYFNL